MYIHTPKAHPVRMYMANSKNDYLSHKSASMMCVVLTPHFPCKAMLTPKTLSEALGHATVAFTLDVYGHSNADMRQQAAEQLEQLICQY
jgi:integrase